MIFTEQQQLIIDCSNITSGTMATLTGHTKYKEIEEIQTAFVVWVMEANISFVNWMKAWEAFKVREKDNGTLQIP